MYGLGAAAHVAIQVAHHWNIGVYAISRDPRHRKLALDLGARVWAGGSDDEPPEKVDAAMIFVPDGDLQKDAESDIEVVSYHRPTTGVSPAAPKRRSIRSRTSNSPFPL